MTTRENLDERHSRRLKKLRETIHAKLDHIVSEHNGKAPFVLNIMGPKSDGLLYSNTVNRLGGEWITVDGMPGETPSKVTEMGICTLVFISSDSGESWEFPVNLDAEPEGAVSATA